MKRLVLFFFLICSFAFAEIKETYIPKLEWKTNVKGDVISVYETNNNLAVLTRYFFVHNFATGSTQGVILRIYIIDKKTGAIKMKFANKMNEFNMDLASFLDFCVVDGSKLYFVGRNTSDLGVMQVNVGFGFYLYCINIDKAVVEWKIKVKKLSQIVGKVGNKLILLGFKGYNNFKAFLLGVDLNKKIISYEIPIIAEPKFYFQEAVIDINLQLAFCQAFPKGLLATRKLVAIDLNTGKVLWSKGKTKKKGILILSYDNNTVYFYDFINSKIIGLDIKTGEENFKRKVSFIPYRFFWGGYYIKENKSMVFVVSKKPEKVIYAINKKDGEISWKIPWKKKNQFIVSDENLCVFQKKQVKFYDARNGQFMWSFDTDEKVSDPKLFEIEDTIVLIPNNRFIYLLDKKTGQISNKLADKGKIVSSYYSNNKLFVVFKKLGKVICCEYELPSFNLIWEKEFSTIFKDVIWYGEKNNLYVVWGKNIFWFDLITGKLLSSFKCDGGFVSAHVSEGDSTKILYVNTKKLLKVSKSGTILSKYILEKSN